MDFSSLNKTSYLSCLVLAGRTASNLPAGAVVPEQQQQQLSMRREEPLKEMATENPSKLPSGVVVPVQQPQLPSTPKQSPLPQQGYHPGVVPIQRQQQFGMRSERPYGLGGAVSAQKSTQPVLSMQRESMPSWSASNPKW
jgi:hypothetical protein